MVSCATATNLLKRYMQDCGPHRAVPGADDKAGLDVLLIDPAEAQPQILSAARSRTLFLISVDRHHTDGHPAQQLTATSNLTVLAHQGIEGCCNEALGAQKA